MALGEILIIVFTGVVAVSTVIYAILTGLLVSETRRMRRVQTEPLVSIRLEGRHGGGRGLDLVIRNEGQGIARDVRFAFQGDPSYFKETYVGNAPPEVDKLPLIRDGIDSLGPGDSFRISLGTMDRAQFERAATAPWVFCTECKDISGLVLRNRFSIDFSLFRDLIVEPDRMQEISDSLGSIKKDLNRIVQGRSHLHVVTHTPEELQHAREERLRQYGLGTGNSTEISNRDH